MVKTLPANLPLRGLFYFTTMTWAEQLRTVEWNTKRTEILIRDHFKCQYPGCNVQFWGLEVHHIEYIGGTKAWEYSNDMLKTLCHNHHSDHHEGVKLAEKALVSTLRMRGFLLGDLLALSCLVDSDIEFTTTLLKTLAEQ